MDETISAVSLAPRVKGLLEGDDFEALGRMLDPDVTWAAAEFPDDGCRNRKEVLAWWRTAYEAGVRAEVTRVEVHGDSLLVSLKVRGREQENEDRFQILVVGRRGVTEIAGYETRTEAVAHLDG